MQYAYFRSKALIYFLVGTFLLLITAETLPGNRKGPNEKSIRPVVRVKKGVAVTAAQQRQFRVLMEEGKKLYYDMDSEDAINIFLKASELAITNEQKAEVYFYLSLSYFSILEAGYDNELLSSLNKLVAVDYYRQLDEELCPSRYIEMFRDIKKNYGVLKVRSNPAGAQVYINDARGSAGTTPLTIATLAGDVKLEVKKGNKKKKATLRVIAEQETQSPEYELKGGSSMLYIVGGVLLAGGVGAAVALGGGKNPPMESTQSTLMEGTITINSSPSGAKVFLDGSDRGMVTPTMLTNVSAGSHTVKLVKEGYVDFEESVTVTAGQTTTVNAELSQHVINFSSPTRKSEWMVGDVLEIKWEMEQSSQGRHSYQMLPATMVSPVNLRVQRSVTNPSGPAGSRPGFVRGASLRRSRTTSHSMQTTITSALHSSVRMRRLPLLTAGVSAPQHQSRLQTRLPSASNQGKADTLTLSSVKLDLLESGEFNRAIVSSTENDGLYEWDIPKNQSPGSDFRIRISSTESENVSYNSPRFTILGETIRFVLDKEEVTVPEGKTASFRLKLSGKPQANVDVSVKRISGDMDIAVKSGASLTFTKANWNAYQKVVLAAAEDADRWNGEATIQVSAPDVAKINVTAVEADLHYVPGPVLGVAPMDDFGAAGQVGGPFSPGSKDYELRNYGNSTLNWEITKTADWVTVSKTSGTLEPGQIEKVTLSINSTANSLASGTYTDLVKFTNTVDDVGTTTRKVVLNAQLAAAPNSPTNLSAGTVQAVGGFKYEVTLIWEDNSNNESGFKLERRLSTSPTYSVIATLSANTTSYNDSGFEEGRYKYRAIAFNSYGNSENSNQVTVSIVDPPTNLTFQSLAGPVVRLSWTDNSSVEMDFVIERRVGTGTWAVVGTVGANVTIWSDSQVQAGNTYHYRIQARNTDWGIAGSSDYSNTVTVTIS